MMRANDQEDPKHPHPSAGGKKRTNPLESTEGIPWRHLKDENRDRHRHL